MTRPKKPAALEIQPLPTLEEALQALTEPPPTPEELERLEEGWWKTAAATPEGWQKVNEFRYRQLVLTLFAAYQRIQKLEEQIADLASGSQAPPKDRIM